MPCGCRVFVQVAGFAGLLWGVSLAVVSAPAAAQGSETHHPRLVVVLYPQNNDGSPGNFIVDQSIGETFAAESQEHIEVHNEYLDVAFPRNADDQQAQVDYLHHKYTGRDVDVVFVALSSAFDFVLEHGDLFPGVPIVFCSVEYREVAARDLPANVIGVPIRFDLAATLDLALRLHRQTETVAVVTGASPMDRAWEREARTAFQAYGDRVEFRSLAGLPLGELIQAVSNLPERSIVYYVHVFRDGLGRTSVPAHILQALSEQSNVPIYGHVDTYIGRGIVGGRVFSFGVEGRNAARLALRVMAGEHPETMGIQDISPNTYMFDARQLQRWQISEADLPPRSDIIRHRRKLLAARKTLLL